MKKKFLISIAAGAVMPIVAVNVNVITKNNNLSDVSLVNIEALATEGGGSGRSINCWQEISSSQRNAMSTELTHKTYCGDCQPTLCRSWYTQSQCQ